MKTLLQPGWGQGRSRISSWCSLMCFCTPQIKTAFRKHLCINRNVHKRISSAVRMTCIWPSCRLLLGTQLSSLGMDICRYWAAPLWKQKTNMDISHVLLSTTSYTPIQDFNICSTTKIWCFGPRTASTVPFWLDWLLPARLGSWLLSNFRLLGSFCFFSSGSLLRGGNSASHGKGEKTLMHLLPFFPLPIFLW